MKSYFIYSLGFFMWTFVATHQFLRGEKRRDREREEKEKRLSPNKGFKLILFLFFETKLN